MITEEIKKIENTAPYLIAEILGCSIGQARRFKRGENGLSNHQALYLEDYLELKPRAFDAIHVRYNTKSKK